MTLGGFAPHYDELMAGDTTPQDITGLRLVDGEEYLKLDGGDVYVPRNAEAIRSFLYDYSDRDTDGLPNNRSELTDLVGEEFGDMEVITWIKY